MNNRWILSLPVAAFACAVSLQTAGYAAEAPVPSGLVFLPPPPTENGPDFQRDKEIYQITRAEKGSKRWELAAFDADIKGNSGAWFQDSFGLVITPEQTPETYKLLTLVGKKLSKAGKDAKNHYMRKRPYMYYNVSGSTCAPQDEEVLRTNGSYPSGHSALGWGMALVLAELAPEQQNLILKRGHEIGQSRVICGFHWQSDVDAGRLVASATVAQLHNDDEFTALLAKAKGEIAQAH